MTDQPWLLMNPVSEAPGTRVGTAARLAGLDGRTVGLFWNGKPGGDVLLNEAGRRLAERFRGLRLVRFWETQPETRTFLGNPVASLERMARGADLVIAGAAD